MRCCIEPIRRKTPRCYTSAARRHAIGEVAGGSTIGGGVTGGISVGGLISGGGSGSVIGGGAGIGFGVGCGIGVTSGFGVMCIGFPRSDREQQKRGMTPL